MKPVLILLLAGLALPAAAAELTSAYTTRDNGTECSVIDQAPADEGDWADIVCTGVAGYPYVIRYGDGRETVTYGFAAESGMPSFGPFNYANNTVEWRLRIGEGTRRPVAAIQRWFIANTEGEWARQLLVVSRVGQPDGGGACVVGYVATSVAGANERARALADNAEDFDCGSDAPAVEEAVRDLVPPA